MAITPKYKKCTGTGKAKGHGCGELSLKRTYGLCQSCLKTWLYTTNEGAKVVENFAIRAKNKLKKEQPKRKYIKWTDKDFKDMIQYVQFEICNPYIRERDNINFGRCISSGNAIVDAGHYYPTTETKLRFCCQNIHGQNHSDNRFKGGNLQAYKQGLISRHGQAYFNRLERLKNDCQQWPKLDRIELIKIGKTYEYLHKNKIWCYEHEYFENYKNLINKYEKANR